MHPNVLSLNTIKSPPTSNACTAIYILFNMYVHTNAELYMICIQLYANVENIGK